MAKKSTKKKAKKSSTKTKKASSADYPRHGIRKALRIPKAILDQNAGRECTDREAADFCGVKYGGPFSVELSSSIKYGFLERPGSGKVQLTDLAKQVLRPKEKSDETKGLRKALLNAPTISEVYKHYRGENIPDEPFFGNAIVDNFRISEDKRDEFKAIFLESLRDAQLTEAHGDKQRVIDVTSESDLGHSSADSIESLGKKADVKQGDTCFVMMPFRAPIGNYFESIYKPGIEKAGFRAVRADDDMFATGKIIDQIWQGIHAATVLVAELTGRNPNVFYELGLAHALQKPVVLVSSNEEDVPFDVQHIRVIYYDVYDPFWGEKLTNKIAELSLIHI